MSALQAFRTDFCLMWEKKETKSFDVTTGHAQTTPSYRALYHSWGEHCDDAFNVHCVYICKSKRIRKRPGLALVLRFLECFTTAQPLDKIPSYRFDISCSCNLESDCATITTANTLLPSKFQEDEALKQ